MFGPASQARQFKAAVGESGCRLMDDLIDMSAFEPAASVWWLSHGPSAAHGRYWREFSGCAEKGLNIDMSTEKVKGAGMSTPA